jgi:hypothetical protein
VIDAQTARMNHEEGGQTRQSMFERSSVITSDYEDASLVVDRGKNRLAGKRSQKQKKGRSSAKVAQRWSRDV